MIEKCVTVPACPVRMSRCICTHLYGSAATVTPGLCFYKAGSAVVLLAGQSSQRTWEPCQALQHYLIDDAPK